jgi:GR25 family glycosyltransferase involved in LPS biosynthesis
MKINFSQIPIFMVSKPGSDMEKRGLRYVKQFAMDAVPIYGFRAHNCGISTDYYKSREREKVNAKTITAGLSHFNIWAAIKWMVESRITQHRVFLILEDDVEFTRPDWQSVLNDNLRVLPADWHVVYIGSCCTDGIENHTHIGQELYKLTRGMCTHAYLVNYEGACKLLETNQKVWAPIDVQMLVDSMPRMNFYGVLPRLATQENTNLHP